MVQFLPDLFGLRNILVPGSVLLLAAEGKHDENRAGSVPRNMWAGGASALAATVLTADPVNFSRHGFNRNGLRLATVPVLYRG